VLELTTLITLSVIAGIASYLQTLTGFAFSLILMSAIAATGVIGIGDGVMMTSFLTLANGSYILFSERRYVSVTTVRQIVPVALVATVAGTLLLPVLLSKSLLLLKFILGLIGILSSLSLIRPIHGSAARPPRFVFAMSGLAGGLMGGLFAIPGHQSSMRSSAICLRSGRYAPHWWLFSRPSLLPALVFPALFGYLLAKLFLQPLHCFP